jgi:hypothetical protein
MILDSSYLLSAGYHTMYTFVLTYQLPPIVELTLRGARLPHAWIRFCPGAYAVLCLAPSR